MTDESIASAETVAAKSDPDGTAATSPPRRRMHSIVPIGTLVGRYVLGERIGAGGMGTVYRAHDPKLDREIAVKLVSATDIEAAQQYLEREAQAMAKLSHANVCTVHDIGTWNDQLFIAMELCDSSLASWLLEQRPWREVVLRFVAAGRGLAAAHRIGLVHRDFKPDNVLVHDGVVKVSDFGLVRSSVTAPSTDSNPDRIEGTPAYMAPEQLAGLDVDARADQFAFAVSVWEGVCGGRPFQAEGKDFVGGMLRAIRGRRFMRSTTSDVPARVLNLLERALAVDSQARYASLDVLVDALERAARPTRKRWVALGIAAIVLAAGTTAGVMHLTRPASDLSPRVVEIRRGAAHLLVVVGDLMSHGQKRPSPTEGDFERARQAYTLALDALGDNELRPKLARVLRSLSGRCYEAVMQMEAYLNAGGRAATSADLATISFAVEGAPRDPIDQAYLVEMKLECDAQTPSTEVGLTKYADLAWRTGDFEAAVDAYLKLHVMTNEAGWIKTAGDVRRSQGSCDDARRYYDQYLALEKKLPKDWIENVKHAGKTCEPAP